MNSIAIPRESILGAELFPLALTPIEHFMLWDDTLDHPKRFRVVLDVEGGVDNAIARRALAAAAVRHPLVVSRLAIRDGRPQWGVPDEPQLGFISERGRWDDSPFPDEWDLAHESGVRVWVSQAVEDIQQIAFDVHHASVDGLGMRQFVADFIIAYDHFFHQPDQAPELKRMDPQRLVSRGHFVRPKPTEEVRSTTLWEKIKLGFEFHVRGPAALAPTQSRTSMESQRYHYRRKVFNEAEMEVWKSSLQGKFEAKLPASARDKLGHSESSAQSLSTLNDCILSRLFCILAEWNARQHGNRPNQRLRIMVPTDLRTFADGRLPAANRFGFGFVVADQKGTSDSHSLLQSVTHQTQAMRKYLLGLDFVEIFGQLMRAPGVARRLVQIPRCMATATLTNLGDLSRRHRRALADQSDFIRLGNLRLRCVTCVPPLRPKTWLGVGVCGTQESLTIALVLDSHHFSSQDADRIMKAIESHEKLTSDP